MVCMITYDLNTPGKDYDNIIKTIKDCSTGVWCTFWKSSYLIKTNKSVDDIQSELKPFLDSNDRLIIIEVKKNYQGWLIEEDWDYINNMFD